MEVADSSLRADRREKGQLYAQAGLSVYWIVNVEDGQIEVYTDPDPAAKPPTYLKRTDYQLGQDVPIVLDGVTVGSVPVSDLIP
jgi:Uma2 family endonuclease